MAQPFPPRYTDFQTPEFIMQFLDWQRQCLAVHQSQQSNSFPPVLMLTQDAFETEGRERSWSSVPTGSHDIPAMSEIVGTTQTQQKTVRMGSTTVFLHIRRYSVLRPGCSLERSSNRKITMNRTRLWFIRGTQRGAEV